MARSRLESGSARRVRRIGNEVIYVLSGRMTVTPEGGEPTEIGAGDVAVFALGWTGTWDIHETVRKVYSVF